VAKLNRSATRLGLPSLRRRGLDVAERLYDGPPLIARNLLDIGAGDRLHVGIGNRAVPDQSFWTGTC